MAKKAARLTSTRRRVAPRNSGNENELAPTLGIAVLRVYGKAVRCHGNRCRAGSREGSRQCSEPVGFGQGTTTRLRCPAASTARTPKTTLSLERGTVRVMDAPTACGESFRTNCQPGGVGFRHND